MSEKKFDFGELAARINTLVDLLKEDMGDRENNASIINNNFEILNSKMDTLKKRVSSIEEKINKLHSETSDNFDDVSKEFDEVKMELVKIRKTSGYDGTFDNLKIIEGTD